MSLRRVAIPSPNYSSRGGARVRLIVLHTAQGATTYQSLGSFFSNPASVVSSHTGIDDTPNEIGEYVRRDGKAWTAANANPYSIQTELCAFAEWSTSEWYRHPTMLENCAKWIAEEAAFFGIPIRKLSAGEAQGGASGVCQHADLGAMGGGHWDCGPGFPIDDVLARASGAASPAPPPQEEGHNMIAATKSGNGYWCCTHDGAIYAYGDAQDHGGAFHPDLTQGNTVIVGIAGKNNDGYWMYASDGSIFAFGSAAFMGRPDRY